MFGLPVAERSTPLVFLPCHSVHSVVDTYSSFHHEGLSAAVGHNSKKLNHE